MILLYLNNGNKFILSTSVNNSQCPRAAKTRELSMDLNKMEKP
jgi:hypothetical protein